MLSRIIKWCKGGWKKANIAIIFKKGKTEGFEELLASQSHFNPWKDYGANLSWSHFQAHKGQENGREKSNMGLSRANCVLPTRLPYVMRTGSVHKRRAVDALYLDHNNTFNTVSHNILTAKLVRYGQRKSELYRGLPDSRVIISGTNHVGCLWRGPYYLTYLLAI